MTLTLLPAEGKAEVAAAVKTVRSVGEPLPKYGFMPSKCSPKRNPALAVREARVKKHSQKAGKVERLATCGGTSGPCSRKVIETGRPRHTLRKPSVKC